MPSTAGGKRLLESAARGVSPPPAAKRKVRSATTKDAVTNFFKPASQKTPESTTWKVVDGTLLVGKYSSPSCKEGKRGQRTMVAGFDLDGTLIVTRSGNRHAKTESDWKWWDESVPAKLRKMYDEGYLVAVFTNQAGLKAPKKDTALLKKFKLKVAAILETIDVPLTVYAATENDRFRKPRSGMWEEMKGDRDLGVRGIDLENSYLVGDAAGREADFSDSDRHWAMNVGIKFHTPEEYFRNEPSKPLSHHFDPTLHIQTAAAAGNQPFAVSGKQELVIFVGSPGAGKSTFYRRFLEPLGFERVNQDTLKSRDKCVRVAREFLGQGKSVAVDNTNADIATRAIWISLARDKGVPIRCVYFTAPPELCKHNDAVRAFGGELTNPEKRTVLPRVAFTGYASRFNKPDVSEGFKDLTEIEFQVKCHNIAPEAAPLAPVL